MGLMGVNYQRSGCVLLSRSLSPPKASHKKKLGFVLESGGEDRVNPGVASAGRVQCLTLD
jgi:hypothetical protein